MTVITLGNLPTFNFIVVDTQTSNNTANFGKLRAREHVNKLIHFNKENSTFTFSGSSELFHTICDYENLSLIKLIKDRKYREEIVAYVNGQIKIDKPKLPLSSKFCIMNKKDLVRWIIMYDRIKEIYYLKGIDIFDIPDNTLYLTCFGDEPSVEEINIDISKLTIDNFNEIVFKRMKEIHHEWAYQRQEEFLEDIIHYSSGYILKNDLSNPPTVIKYYSPV